MQYTNQFDVFLLSERALLMRALGEVEMYRSITQHLKATQRLAGAKQAGAWGREAWESFVQESRAPERRRVIKAAQRRKQELGWLAAPGKPGPAAARNDGTNWLPLPPRDPEVAAAAALAAKEAARQQREERELQRQMALEQGHEAGEGEVSDDEDDGTWDDHLAEGDAVSEGEEDVQSRAAELWRQQQLDSLDDGDEREPVGSEQLEDDGDGEQESGRVTLPMERDAVLEVEDEFEMRVHSRRQA